MPHLLPDRNVAGRLSRPNMLAPLNAQLFGYMTAEGPQTTRQAGSSSSSETKNCFKVRTDESLTPKRQLGQEAPAATQQHDTEHCPKRPLPDSLPADLPFWEARTQRRRISTLALLDFPACPHQGR